jgi:hypothetical protein
MSIIGTKKFWKPAQGAGTTQKENQILKNTGYINLQLYCVNYMSIGNFWQKTFGGKDNIALATNLKYQTGVESIEATSVQDVRVVKTNKNYNLGLQRNIAVKIPASADAITIDVKMTAIKDDKLQAKFDMLNKPEYQAALELAPTVVGQVITITSLVKKLFSDSDPQAQLEASYASIISNEQESNPVNNGKLTKGYLIMISTNEGDPFNNVDESKFEIKGDTLHYNNKQVENTYIIFNISFEPLKGQNENANWFKKYNEAINNLDKIQLTTNSDEIEKIFNNSKTTWIEGNALLDADATYINNEKIKIKSLAIKTIKDRYSELTNNSNPLTATTDVLQGIAGKTAMEIIKEALPITIERLSNKIKLQPDKTLNFNSYEKAKHKLTFNELIDEDADSYIKELKNNNLDFKLGKNNKYRQLAA